MTVTTHTRRVWDRTKEQAVDVNLVIFVDQEFLATNLAQKAFNNKHRNTTALHGGVKVKVKE
jgi:hypothetical protein